MTLEEVVRIFDAVRSGSEWKSKCPCHDDSTASLFFKNGGDKILVTCRAGCDTADVLSSKGLKLSDLFDEAYKPLAKSILAEYTYHSADGAIAFQVVRLSPKDFRQRHPDGSGGWVWNMDGVDRVPYRLPGLLSADPDDPVFIVEGEKDADALTNERLIATTNPGGAGKWRPEYSQFFKDRRVVVIPDNDVPGRKHAAEILAALEPIAKSVRVLELEELPVKGDVSDWLKTHTIEELITLAGTKPDLWLTPEAAIAALALDGEPIPTGFGPLDRQFRKGGIPPGRVMVIGGPPFAGKTTLVADVALHMSKRAPVFALFSDEGRSQAAVRLGVMLGVGLQQIDDDPLTSSVRVGELMDGRSIHLLKPDTQQSYAENVVEYALTKVQKGSPAIILLDSVQTILARRPTDDQAPESPRIAAKSLVTACRAWAEKHNFTFILTSQANRAFYRSKKEDENSVAIAAFSESGAIEYMADVAIVLSLPDEKSEIVKVRFVKNRLKGTAKSFQVRYSSDTGRLMEIDDASAEEATAEESRQRLLPVKDRILKELRRHKEGLTRMMIQDSLTSRKADVLAAIRTLVDEKRVYPEQRGRQLFYVLDRSREDDL